jgi:hypothetical protein
MPLRAYRARHPTLALFLEDGRYVARTIPSGACITVDSDSIDGESLVNVAWGGKDAMMFTHDLHSRFLPVADRVNALGLSPESYHRCGQGAWGCTLAELLPRCLFSNVTFLVAKNHTVSSSTMTTIIPVVWGGVMAEWMPPHLLLHPALAKLKGDGGK